MKPPRVLLIIVAALVILLAVLAGVALNSGFQTWAARKALAAQTDIHGTIGRVDAGLRQTSITGVALRLPEATVTIPAAEIAVPLFGAATKNVQVKRLVARGWTVDLTPAGEMSPAGAAGATQAVSAQAAAVFRGIFDQLQLPVDLALDHLELEGDVLLPAASGQPPLRVHVTLAGGGLGTGRTGTFTLEAATTMNADAPVRTLTAHSVITAAMDSPRTFSRLAVKTELNAAGPQLAHPTQLTIDSAAERSNGAERYTADVTGDGRRLLNVRADYPAGAPRLTGTWEIAMSDADVAPYALGYPLPRFTAAGAGRFESDGAFSSMAASGKLDATAERLERVDPQLGALGALKLNADFDLMHESAALRVTRLNLAVAGAHPVLRVEALQPFAFNPQTAELRIADPAKALLDIVLESVPLAWAQSVAPGLTLTGEAIRGEFFLSAREGGLSLRPRAPLSLGGLGIAQAGAPWARNLDVTLSPTFDYTLQGWQADAGRLVVRSGGATLLELNARAGQLAGRTEPLKVAGDFSLNLPAVVQQPALGGKFALLRGAATGDFAASIDGRQQLQAKLAVSDLAVDPKLATGTLPAITAELRANVETDGRITVTAPLAIEREGRKSDLTLAGTVTSGAGGATAIDARLTGDYIWLDDVKLLAAPLGSGPEPASQPGGPVQDEKPLWAGVSGQVALALKKVVYGTDFELSNVAGTLKIDAGAMTFDQAQAQFGADSQLRAAGGLTFDAQAAAPYGLKADVQLTNFDSGPLFKAIAPGKPAAVDGRFNGSTRLTARGISLDDVLARTRGDVTLTSKGGRFRVLSVDLADKLQKAQTTMAAIGGLIGAVTGKTSAPEYTAKAQAVVDIARTLSDIAYDQLNVAVTRDAELNVQVQDFSLIAPEVRLSGAGEIRHAEDVPLLKSAMALTFQLGARGKLGELMKRVNLLEAKQDTLGYTSFSVPLKIGGSPGEPDTSNLQRALLDAALEKSGLLEGLLGK